MDHAMEITQERVINPVRDIADAEGAAARTYPLHMRLYSARAIARSP